MTEEEHILRPSMSADDKQGGKQSQKSKNPSSENDDEDGKDELKVEDLAWDQRLFYYAKMGDAAGIREIHKAKPDGFSVNSKDNGRTESSYKSQDTALHYSCASGSLECVKLLLNLAANIEETNKLGSTPLHVACAYGHTDIVQHLLSQEASTTAQNAIKNTPLHCAVYGGHVGVVKLLLAKRDVVASDVLLQANGVGQTPLRYAAHPAMKEYLKEVLPRTSNDDSGDPDEDSANAAIEVDGRGTSNDDGIEEVDT